METLSDLHAAYASRKQFIQYLVRLAAVVLVLRRGIPLDRMLHVVRHVALIGTIRRDAVLIGVTGSRAAHGRRCLGAVRTCVVRERVVRGASYWPVVLMDARVRQMVLRDWRPAAADATACKRMPVAPMRAATVTAVGAAGAHKALFHWMVR
jgi:hypothetical protein